MDADNIPAIGAFPFLLFCLNKFPNPVFFYGVQIFNHTHSVLSPVTFINMFNPFAGIDPAGIAQFNFAA